MQVLLAIVAGFAGGVFARSLFVFGWPVIGFVLFLCGIFCIARYTSARRAYTLCAIFLLCAALGMIRGGLSDHALPQPFASEVGQKVAYEGVVVADPDVRDATQRVQIRVSEGEASTILLAVADRYPQIAVGERVSVSGTLEVPEPFASEGGRVFRYDKYLQKEGVYYLLSFARITIRAEAPWYSLPAFFARIKHAFTDGLSATLPEPYASLAGGLVIGGKSGLGTKLQDAFIISGLVQVIVLSGYNVMIVAEWMMRGLAVLRLRRRTSAFAGALALIIFVLIAGLSATAVRAALMALIALYARATGRSYAAGRALLVVILLMLVVNPPYLVYDPGFGLSVVATAGLIWLAPLIELRLVWIKNTFLRDAFATTLAAQVAVLPLLLYDTGNLSLVAVPANVLVNAMVPLAMAASAIAGVAGAILGSLALPLALPAYGLTFYIIEIAKAAAALPLAALTLPAFPFVLVVAAYALLGYWAFKKRSSTTPQLRLAKNASM